MKVSVSLEQRDIEYLDDLTASGEYPSRSAALAAAVRLLRGGELSKQYVEAYREWDASDDADLWDATAGDAPTGSNGAV